MIIYNTISSTDRVHWGEGGETKGVNSKARGPEESYDYGLYTNTSNTPQPTDYST